MIFSIMLRSFKTYNRQSYIPISNGSMFTAFIGENGIGKSSIVEALDTYFNKPQTDWNYHHSVISKGVQEREPVICPIFLVKKNILRSNSNIYKYLNAVSDVVWQLEYEDFNSAQHKISREFCEHRDSFLVDNPDAMGEYFLFPIGLKVESLRPRMTKKTMGVFDSIQDFEDIYVDFDISQDKILEEIYYFVVNLYSFIYIPADLDFEEFTKIEGKAIQSLMGSSVDEMIKQLLDNSFISEINKKLDKFISDISSKLEKYEYKKPGKKQTLFNSSHLTSKIIETYFESKVLNLKSGNNNTPIYNCSSGEKRMALIDLAKAFLQSVNLDNNKQIIIAIDEPEISLHTSSCFEQFEKIKSISNGNVQTLLTTHWYGFMPVVSHGSAIYIAERGEEKIYSLIDLRCFKDELSRLRKISKGKFPKEIELKSNNDLVQSIVASITSRKYNWIICEGSSDKIYLEHFIGRKTQVYILPMGKSSNVKKLFKYLYLALSEERSDIKGKVYMILDTDRSFELFQKEGQLDGVEIKRLQNDIASRSTKLYQTSDNNFYPPTEMEDCLLGEEFLDVLFYFSENGYEDYLKGLLNGLEVKYSRSCSGLAFDLKDSQRQELNTFFDLPGVKIKFALKYVELSPKNNIPDWISEVLDFLN